jgi:hypothetical protein
MNEDWKFGSYYVWDNLIKKNELEGNKNSWVWSYASYGNKEEKNLAPPAAVQAAHLRDVKRRCTESGFLEDVLSFLEAYAPRKLYGFLKGLCVAPGPISYENLCEAIWKLEFRVGEVIERRMILGEGNEWTRKYFSEFGVR